MSAGAARLRSDPWRVLTEESLTVPENRCLGERGGREASHPYEEFYVLIHLFTDIN
jgi:hypothetical protein